MYDQPLNSTVLKSASIPKDLGDFYEEMKHIYILSFLTTNHPVSILP